jgi:hypothetical protein
MNPRHAERAGLHLRPPPVAEEGSKCWRRGRRLTRQLIAAVRAGNRKRGCESNFKSFCPCQRNGHRKSGVRSFGYERIMNPRHAERAGLHLRPPPVAEEGSKCWRRGRRLTRQFIAAVRAGNRKRGCESNFKSSSLIKQTAARYWRIRSIPQYRQPSAREKRLPSI